tara:strand:+ start:590 stop:991 length:402 start_codon:yes stop_codon:yes gene_type:complete
MNDKSEIVKTFNEKLVEFVKDLILLYNDNDLYNFKNSINMITLIDERKPIKIFRDVIVNKYKKQLFTKDEHFFLEHHYEDEMACREKEEVDMSTNLVVKIKSYWKDLTNENKEIIWKYFKLLVILCEKYFELV